MRKGKRKNSQFGMLAYLGCGAFCKRKMYATVRFVCTNTVGRCLGAAVVCLHQIGDCGSIWNAPLRLLWGSVHNAFACTASRMRVVVAPTPTEIMRTRCALSAQTP